MRNGDEPKISFCFCQPIGLRASTWPYSKRGGLTVSGEFAADKVSGGWFLFYWGLMILWVMRMGFDDTVSGMWNVSRVIPGPYRWVCETLLCDS